jgi:SsrA-binding protein
MPSYTFNRKALFGYSIDESVEAGIVLSGHEVKSVRGGNVNLAGAYVTIRNGEAFLRNAHIGKYKHAGELPGYDENRERKLLLKKPEIFRLQDRASEKGVSLIPLELYTTKKRIKLKIAIAKGKQQQDKRDSIRKREVKRTLDRAVRRKI